MSTFTSDLTNLSLSDVGAPPAPPAPPPVRQLRAAKPADKKGWWWGTGRRKAAVARIRMKPGDQTGITIETKAGKVKTVEQYFAEERDRNDAMSPLKLVNLADKVRVVAKISGGGFMGQAQALRLAISRALRDYDPTTELALREAGFLTRDARKVERKKYGQAGARRRFQFSKR